LQPIVPKALFNQTFGAIGAQIIVLADLRTVQIMGSRQGEESELLNKQEGP
jgi:hypothetical protein